MPETSCDPRTTLATLPVEIQLKIFRYVMASDAPVDLQEFVELGRELQSGREARSESYTEGESVVLEEQRLSTQEIMEGQRISAWQTQPQHSPRSAMFIAPLAFDCNARDFRTLSRYHALSCMKVLSIQHRTYGAIIRSLGRPAVVDLAAVDRILPPQELLDFLPDLGLRVDQVHVDLIVDGDKDIVEHLTSEVYPGLRKSAAREARRWRS
ncbi:hypothetical protein MMC22_006781 [Lobaria immixta]|nr:hypothetical protein [Lobaria immixta]